MGVSYSNSLQHLQNEIDIKFLRPLESTVHCQKILADRPFEERARRVLFTYPSLLLVGFMDGMSIDLGHLAVLFVLDADRDGLFSWRDIAAFVEWVHNAIPTDEKELGNEFSDAVHARCVLQMWRECTGMVGNPGDDVALLSGGFSGDIPDVMSVNSSPSHDPLNRSRRSNSAVSLGTTQFGATSGERASSRGGGVNGAEGDRELFEEWFERFLSKNFPFAADRVHQQAPLSIDEVEGRAGTSPTTIGGTSSQYNRLVVDVAGEGSIAVAEVTPSELRRHPKALSLDAIAAAHALLIMQDDPAVASITLKEFCVALVGQANIRRQGRDFACPAKALRAFNSAFVDSYWASLRRFGLQPLL